jgi:hypothetical protein
MEIECGDGTTESGERVLTTCIEFRKLVYKWGEGERRSRAAT